MNSTECSIESTNSLSSEKVRQSNELQSEMNDSTNQFAQTLSSITRVLNQVGQKGLLETNEMDTDQVESKPTESEPSNEFNANDSLVNETSGPSDCDANDDESGQLPPHPSEITFSARGSLQLRGFTYNLNSRCKDRRYYKCSQYRIHSCLSRLMEHKGKFVIRGPWHQHPTNVKSDDSSKSIPFKYFLLREESALFRNDLHTEPTIDYGVSTIDNSSEDNASFSRPQAIALAPLQDKARNNGQGLTASNVVLLNESDESPNTSNERRPFATDSNRLDDSFVSNHFTSNSQTNRLESTASISNVLRPEHLLTQAWSLNQSYEEVATMVEHGPVRISIERSEHLRNAVSIEFERLDGHVKIKIGSKLPSI